MDAKTFFNTVARMRTAQKEYFKFRSQTALRESKRLEKEVDEEINRVQALLQEQNNLKLKF